MRFSAKQNLSWTRPLFLGTGLPCPRPGRISGPQNLHCRHLRHPRLRPSPPCVSRTSFLASPGAAPPGRPSDGNFASLARLERGEDGAAEAPVDGAQSPALSTVRVVRGLRLLPPIYKGMANAVAQLVLHTKGSQKSRKFHCSTSVLRVPIRPSKVCLCPSCTK